MVMKRHNFLLDARGTSDDIAPYDRNGLEFSSYYHWMCSVISVFDNSFLCVHYLMIRRCTIAKEFTNCS